VTFARAASLVQVLAVSLLGLMAGFFFAFAVDVAPAMRSLDAHGYITTQQAINQAVRNLPFALAYFGAAVLPAMCAGLLWLSGRKTDAVIWSVIALIYVLGVFVLTREVNIPINNALALWNPSAPPSDWARARDHWNEANLQRCVAACVAFFASVAARTWPLRDLRDLRAPR
jgi:uncharacterized membrane protein